MNEYGLRDTITPVTCPLPSSALLTILKVVIGIIYLIIRIGKLFLVILVIMAFILVVF